MGFPGLGAWQKKVLAIRFGGKPSGLRVHGNVTAACMKKSGCLSLEPGLAFSDSRTWLLLLLLLSSWSLMILLLLPLPVLLLLLLLLYCFVGGTVLAR